MQHHLLNEYMLGLDLGKATAGPKRRITEEVEGGAGQYLVERLTILLDGLWCTCGA